MATPLAETGLVIVVCAKAVPDDGGGRRLSPETGRLDRSGDLTVNPADVHAVEQALRLVDIDGSVVVVSMAPEHAVEPLRRLLAMGVDRVVLVSDDALAGSDVLGTSLVLARAVELERPDLVIFGQQASDSEGGLMWAAVAERLHMPVISQAIEVQLGDGTVMATRQTEHGVEEVEAQLPAVIAVSDSINEPRFPSLKGVMDARRKLIMVRALAELAVDASHVGERGSSTEVYRTESPSLRGDATVIEDTGDAAERIIGFLRERLLA